MPRQLQMSGIQSVKVTWKSEPLRPDLLKAAASMTKKTEREN
jgi:hypothetical protein